MRDQGWGGGDWVEALRANFQLPISNFKVNEPLGRYTTSRLGGPAEALIEATSAAELKDIVIAARKVEAPILILGGGANVLVSDAGVRGLTIINKAKRIEFRADNAVWCEAGTVLPTLARECIAHGLSGLEWAVGVPGTVGGAVVGNAGAHGRDTATDLVSATILNAANEVVEWSNADLQFEYRSSRIKRDARRKMQDAGSKRQDAANTEHAPRTTEHVVLAATFRLTPGDPVELEKKAAEFNDYRRRTQPPGASLGSMFKNPPGNAAGRLIDECGLKGTRIGGVEISMVHANFFVNDGHATATDVKALIDLARTTVLERFGIELELEIELIGDW
ncbi:UDP-N-acetylmuramate dehydrogenase [Anaerolineae bacterium]|nr:UDP-N-acetylmuramate dehydrogenase [Anaerolineae bacterium]